MKQSLNYGRITWSYEDDFNPLVPCCPTPFVSFLPVKINSRQRYPNFSDRVGLALLKQKASNKITFREAYRRWYLEDSWDAKELGEGRSFLKWVSINDFEFDWKQGDFRFHSFFCLRNSPRHSPDDELARGLSFAVQPVSVGNRKVKLYLEDDAVLNLFSLPYGDEEDFLDLVKEYIFMRHQREAWKAPAPPFLEWVKCIGKRPVFLGGQLGLSIPHNR